VEHTTLSAQWLESIRAAELRRCSGIDGQDKARTVGSNVEVLDFFSKLANVETRRLGRGKLKGNRAARSEIDVVGGNERQECGLG
jgi:hypothetical protein